MVYNDEFDDFDQDEGNTFYNGLAPSLYPRYWGEGDGSDEDDILDIWDAEERFDDLMTERW